MLRSVTTVVAALVIAVAPGARASTMGRSRHYHLHSR
jgi:hypothetical protein